MRAVVHRVSRAKVEVGSETVGAIEAGLCVLLSVGPHDDQAIAERLAGRIATLRVFPDAAGRMNLDVASSGGAILAVSQFTLHADTSRGHRPAFVRAATPERAAELYDAFVAALRLRVPRFRSPAGTGGRPPELLRYSGAGGEDEQLAALRARRAG